MGNLLENWISSHEMLQVREIRRRRLCLALTYLGSVFLLIFGVFALFRQYYFLSSILLGSVCVGVINSFLLLNKENLKLGVSVLSVILFILAITLIITGGVEGTGMLWVYPIFAILLFINQFRLAIYLSVIVIAISSLLLFSPLSELLQYEYSQVHAIRFLITLIALTAISLTAIYSEEVAYKMLMRLHNDDIHRLAFYDSLTGLPNRWTLQNNLERLLKRRENDQIIALLYIDLDNFKHVNDNFGHEIGDKLLSGFGEKLNNIIRPGDIVSNDRMSMDTTDDVARLAGDEFVIILNNLKSPMEAANVAKRIVNVFDGGYELDGTVYPVYASIGIAVCPDDSDKPSDLLRYADAAMYKAKSKGNNCFEYFTSEIAEHIRTIQKIENGLNFAIETEQFSLVYLPMYCCQSKEMVGIEVLLRCDHPQLNGFGPDQFIPVAESTGLIKKIDLWVLENSLKDFDRIRKETDFHGKLCINVSGVELLDEGFPNKIIELLSKYELPSNLIELEITETSLVPENHNVLKVLAELNKIGLTLSLDDFGTGYTSFNQLILYPAKCLKIDRSFVNDLFSSNEVHGKMVQVIHNLASIYKLRVVAEGVETEEQYNYLKDIGCDWVQGYYFSKPVDRDKLIKLLSKT